MNRSLHVFGVALLTFSVCLPALAMDRPLQHVVAAIQYAQPQLNPATTHAWAKVIREEAIARHFDPLTLVAIVRYESGFNPHAVNDNPPREYSVGLVQVNVLAINGPCRGTELLPTASCQAMISRLQDGAYNLRYGARMISSWKALCRQRTGRPALFARWLSGFQGYDRRSGVVCNQRRNSSGRWHDLPVPGKTQRVMDYRRQLIRILASRQTRASSQADTRYRWALLPPCGLSEARLGHRGQVRQSPPIGAPRGVNGRRALGRRKHAWPVGQ